MPWRGRLQLDEAERQHLFDLARTASDPRRPGRVRPKPPATRVRPAVLSILNGMTGTPAYVRNARLDILAANDLCLALYDGVLTRDELPFNLDAVRLPRPLCQGLLSGLGNDRPKTRSGPCAREAGRDPSDRGLSDLIGELATRSDGFATRWARHDVRLHRTARKRLGNRIVGEIELTGDALDLAGDGLTIIAYSAAPGSPAEDQLQLLATWSATTHTPASEAAGISLPGDEPG